MRSRGRRLVALAGIVLLASIAVCTPAPPSKVVRIGVELPLSGAEGRAGTAALNGVRFFVHQHPTADGFTVEVAPRDDAIEGVHNPEQGARNIESLVADPLVAGVVGPFDASVARTEIPLANLAGLALVSPAVSSRCLTKEPYLPAGLNPSHVAVGCKAAGFPTPAQLRPTGTNNFFRLSTTDDLQGPAAADYLYKNMLLRRVAVLSDHEAYGQALAASFRTRFTKLGGSVVSVLDFDPTGSIDVTGFMRKAKADGAQAIYYGGVTANHGCVIRAQMASVLSPGEATPFFGGDGIAQDPDCIRNAGANAVGVYATVPAVAPDYVAAAQPIVQAFKAEFGNVADYGAYTMAGYDAAGVLYTAIDRAIQAAGGQLPRRDDVVTQIARAISFTGALGTFGFDSSGDTTQRVVSIFEARSTDPAVPWGYINAVDYSAALPY